MSKPELAHCDLTHDYSNEGAKLLYADGGRYLKLSFARSSSADWNAEMFCARGGVRGKCKGFSFGSRRRMLNRLNSVSCAAKLPYFVTMTLPDDVFDDNAAAFAKKAKVWLDTFVKRLLRACPTASGFWRIEWQSRKSGVYEGKLVPHFHLLVWGLPERVLRPEDFGYNPRTGQLELVPEIKEAFIECRDGQMTLELVNTLGTAPEPAEWQRKTSVDVRGKVLTFAGSHRFVHRCRDLCDNVDLMDHATKKVSERARNMSFVDWAALAWYNVVDSHNVAHLTAGVRVERVRTWGGVMSYCAKYMAKSDCGFLYSVEFGRSWGIFNRKAVPWAKMVELNLDNDVGVRLRRVARRYLERRFGRRVRSPYGITLYCDVSKLAKLWEPPPDTPF